MINPTEISLKSQIIRHYVEWVEQNISSQDFFTKNKALTHGTLLCPSGLLPNDIKQYLCRIAEGKIEVLFPGIGVESLNEAFPSLDELNLLKICQTHIISDDGQYLLPVKLLLSTEPRNQVFNPYYDFEKGGHDRISQSEWARMEQHSAFTKRYVELAQEIEEIQNQTDNLYLRIKKLCRTLSFNDAHGGRGSSNNAAGGAYQAIIEFFTYYDALTPESKESIPQNVQLALTTLHNLSSNPQANVNATANTATCIGLRREAIEEAILGHEARLAEIAYSGQEVAGLIQSKQEEQERMKAAILADNYQGCDMFGFTANLLQQLAIRLEFHNLADLNLLKSLEPQEFQVVCETSDFLSVLQNFDEFIGFTHELPAEHLGILAKLNLSRFLTSNQDTKEWLINLHPNQQIAVITTLIDPRYPRNLNIFTLLSQEDYPSNVVFAVLEKLNKEQIIYILTQNLHGYNILTYAERRRPEAIAPLLAHLTPEEKMTILTRVIGDDRNAITFAVKYAPEAIASFLADLTPEQKIIYLTNEDYSSDNILMYAAKYNHEAIAPLLAGLSLEHKMIVLLRTNRFGDSVLMPAAQYQPESIAPLLADLSIEQKMSILLKTNRYGESALMYAARYQPQAITHLFVDLTPDQRINLLRQVINQDSTALNIAIKFKPESVAPLLAELNSEQIYELLTQPKENSDNMIMVAVRIQHQAIAPLLANLTPAQKIELLSQISWFGTNVLMYAAEYRPEAIAPLLAALSPEDQMFVLTQSLHGLNPLMIAAQKTPESIEPLLANLTQDQKITVLTQNSNDINALMLMAQHQPTAFENFFNALDFNPLPPQQKEAVFKCLLHFLTETKNKKSYTFLNLIHSFKAQPQVYLNQYLIKIPIDFIREYNATHHQNKHPLLKKHLKNYDTQKQQSFWNQAPEKPSSEGPKNSPK